MDDDTNEEDIEDYLNEVEENDEEDFDNGEKEDEIEKEIVEVSRNNPKKPNSKLFILIILIVLILSIDFFVLYFLSDFGIVKDNNSLRCSDGTLYEKCSNDKPYYCYDGELLKKSSICGCPDGMKIYFQNCV